MIETSETIRIILEGTPDMTRAIEVVRDGDVVYVFELLEEEGRSSEATLIAFPPEHAATVAQAILLAVRP